MSDGTTGVPLLDHPLRAPSAFTPEALLEAVRLERSLASERVPDVCILEFDGDLTDVTRWPSWPCFHTAMNVVDVDGGRVGVLARTIGGPYAVLVAEQLAASGARVILGLTSAGRVSPNLPVPSLVVPTTAVRDEGTSYHYVPAAATVAADADLVKALGEELVHIGLPVAAGRVWTTDAPYRETREQLDRQAADGVLAVEMQAASLYAFGAARGVCCGIVAHVTNAVGRSQGDQFHKGSDQLGFEILTAMYRAGRRCLTAPLDSVPPATVPSEG
jgi:uridine phosphorylase